MADVTISSLPIGTPSGSGVIPFSQSGTTYTAKPSAIVAASLLTGTWSPYFCRNSDLVDITANNNYNRRDGRWTKIGNLVYVEVEIETQSSWSFSAGTTSNSLLAIGGLPFNTNYYTGQFTCSYFSNFGAWGAGYTPMLLTQQFENNKPSFIAMGYAAAGGWTWAHAGLVYSANSRLIFNGWYTAIS